MPPRIPLRTTASPLGPVTEALSCLSISSSTPLQRSLPALTHPPQPHHHHGWRNQQCPPPSSRRAFSATSAAAVSQRLLAMKRWFKKANQVLLRPKGPNTYLGKVGFKTDGMPATQKFERCPFPSNPHFLSNPVLNDDAREMIWEKIMTRGESVKAVSVELGVDVRRVAAVVRLKEVEKTWIANKKPLARVYQGAVLRMVPTHSYRNPENGYAALEPIHEIPVHPWTQQQLFIPVSESRQFTRADAAHAFHERMLPADARIPHPEYVAMEREVHVDGVAPVEAAKRFREAALASEVKIAADKVAAVERQERITTRVQGKRAEYRFVDVNVDSSGKNGRSLKGVGVRYGVALYDRKKGEVKIPTKVD